MTAWVLPDHIADVLPSEARHIEERRRSLLDTARSYGYELVMPPLIEHLDSLLSGTGQALDLQTFKLVDQLSGRSLGLRADTTTQAARIDAHLLNRQGVARLAYCGPVVHTLPDTPRATREPLQFGCELFGHAGLEADLEVVQLAIDALTNVGVQDLTLDLADAGLLRAVLAQALPPNASAATLGAVHAALAAKDQAALELIVARHPSSSSEAAQALLALPHLYGDCNVLEVAQKLPFFADHESKRDAGGLLYKLAQIADQIATRHPQVRLSIDLGDARGYGYYTGLRFAIYAPSAGDALLRGGRYDEVGAAFGRSRPAVGFSLDIKALVRSLVAPPVRSAICAPGRGDAGLHAAVARLRRSGETVVSAIGNHAGEVQEFSCDRELLQVAGLWVVQAIDPI